MAAKLGVGFGEWMEMQVVASESSRTLSHAAKSGHSTAGPESRVNPTTLVDGSVGVNISTSTGLVVGGFQLGDRGGVLVQHQ